MSKHLLRTASICLGVSLSIFTACGGKVVVDLTSGSGGGGGTGGTGAGHGGSTSNVMPSTGSDTTAISVGPSTGVGPPPPTACSCQAFCGAIKGCGFPTMQCMNFCKQVSPQTLDCVCQNASTCNIQMCFGASPAGGG